MGKPPADQQPGGFFARAREIAKRDADPRPSRTYVLRCPDCGAPRQRADLDCRFCGGKTTE